MRRICSPWYSRISQTSRISQAQYSRHLLHRTHGSAGAAILPKENSVLSAEALDLLIRWDGPAAAVHLTKANSAANAERRSRKEQGFTSATSVDGNLKIRRIHRNSVLNAEIYSMITILNRKVQLWEDWNNSNALHAEVQ